MKLLVVSALVASTLLAQAPANVLGPGPWTYNTAERNTKIQLSVVARGLSHPWGLVFMPGGDMLVTERPGRVRVLRNGVLDPAPVADLSKLSVDVLFDIALHPKFAENGWVYLTYMKKGTNPTGKGYWATTALARGKWDGKSVTNVADIFVADAWQDAQGSDASRVAFAPDGKLFMSSSHRRNSEAPQSANSHIGKVLRLNDDGSVPKDNPFVGQAGKKPEVYSMGHRTVLGLTFHPTTGELWETENGPQGGDEVNIIKPGKNYGWPVVTFGRDYDGKRLSTAQGRAEFELPELFWVPSVTASGIAFYTGDKIPAWKGNLFLGSMTVGRIGGTGNVQRVAFNENGEQKRETLFQDLHQRFRDVRQGPDGLLYFLTDENDGAILKADLVK
ncbi:MAG: PQQ-dependent sugar dehydrogenase [Bryobacteraceae bacterium]